MKILIIGGTGNISRWLTQQLAERGDDIVLYNRGTKQLPFHGKVKYIIGDRTHHNEFAKQVEGAGIFDCVIDMVGYEVEDAIQAIKIFSGKTAQYIFCSTVDVYSKQQSTYPVPLQQPLNASSSFPYAYKKMQMEKIFSNALEKNNFPITIIRLAATYSEGWSPLVTCFGGASYHLDRLQKKLPVILHGDGSAIWVATHSSDASNAFVNAIDNNITIGKAYNVTGDELLTWKSMYQIVAEILGADEPEFVCIPTDILAKLTPVESEWCVENFQFNNIFDNSAAKEDLKFQYTIPYRQGATRCISWLKENKGIEDCSHYSFYEGVLKKWKSKII